MIKISIVVPVYKVHDYIERCLDSIICQESDDYALECILVNDCTPDDSMHIVERKLREYIGKIDFVIVNHSINKGLSASRNTGIRNAKGDFLFFLDSDDRLEIGAIKYMVDALQSELANKPNVDIIMGNTYICKNSKPQMCYNTDDIFFIDNCDETALKRLLNRELYHIACNKLVKRELLLKYCLFFEEGIIDEDLLWSYLVFVNAKGALLLPKVTYIYEDNPGSIMNTTSERVAQRIESRIIICNKLLSSPPRFSFVEYYMYVFYIMTRAINLYELNNSDSVVGDYRDDLYIIRDRILKEAFLKRYFIMYVFFLTTKKPLSVLNKFRWYRRFYDNIAKCVVIISNKMVK